MRSVDLKSVVPWFHTPKIKCHANPSILSNDLDDLSTQFTVLTKRRKEPKEEKPTATASVTFSNELTRDMRSTQKIS